LRPALHTVLALALLNLTACHHYLPTGIEAVERPDRVRVTLSEPIDVELLDLTARDIVLLDGEVVRWDDDTLVLSVWWLTASNGMEFRAQGETTVVPREQLNHLELKQFSLLKTIGLAALFTGLLAVGVGTLAAAGVIGSGSGPSDPQQ
jgi:hypothetical protein